MLGTTTPAGLHDYLVENVVPRFVRPGDRAVDLGAGSGLLATRLHGLGLDVLAVDWNAEGYGAPLPFLPLDLNRADCLRSVLDQRELVRDLGQVARERTRCTYSVEQMTRRHVETYQQIHEKKADWKRTKHLT
jgi:hypothetical protein